jgi:sugar fermentation stimulation protein A
MASLYKPFDPVLPGTFISRPNRFLVNCQCNGSQVTAFLPNPGRLQELFLPGCRLYLIKEGEVETRKTQMTVVGVERDSCPIMLHTHKTNDAVSYLLKEKLIPGFEDTVVVRREAKAGRSRFDFLLADAQGLLYVEVKSVTLFGKTVAMFPDAVTARGARHLQELAELSEGGFRCAVIFVVHWPHSTVFMADYHTDLHFARTLLSVKDKIRIIPVAVKWHEDMSLSSEVTVLPIPWTYLEREAHDSGSYLLILELKEDREITFGKSSSAHFKRGFYVYVGSAMTNLSSRIERHKRLRKRFHWHIDWLRAHTSVHAALPIRSSQRLECELAFEMQQITDWTMRGFGCTDCSCPSHLFGMAHDPLSSSPFIKLLQYFRMDRYDEGERRL